MQEKLEKEFSHTNRNRYQEKPVQKWYISRNQRHKILKLRNCWIVATFLLEKLAQPLSIIFHTETKRFLWAKSGNLASCNSSKICFAFPCPIRWFQTVFEFFVKILGFIQRDLSGSTHIPIVFCTGSSWNFIWIFYGQFSEKRLAGHQEQTKPARRSSAFFH